VSLTCQIQSDSVTERQLFGALRYVSKRGSSGCTVKYSKSACRLAYLLIKTSRNRNDNFVGELDFKVGNSAAKKYDILVLIRLAYNINLRVLKVSTK
jgi:hypothetical protein